MPEEYFSPAKPKAVPPAKKVLDLEGIKSIPIPEVTPQQEKEIIDVASQRGYHERSVGAGRAGDKVLKMKKNSAVEVVPRIMPRVIVDQINVRGDVTVINAFRKYTNEHRFRNYVEAIADLLEHGPRKPRLEE